LIAMAINKPESGQQRYPRDRFPVISLRPEIEEKHEEHLAQLSKIINRYSKVGRRSPALYDWVLRLFENLGLSTVEEKYLDSLCLVKTKLVVFTVLVDDTIDNKDQRNLKLFEEVLKIPFTPEEVQTTNFTESEKEYLKLTKDVWKEIDEEIQTYPFYKKYYEAFRFDTYQLLNSMRYSRMVNALPVSANKFENTDYIHHGMLVMLQADLDLMCSKGFDERELGNLRHLMLIAQKIARIGNLYTTYRREIAEEDLSSEVMLLLQEEFGAGFLQKIQTILNKDKRHPDFEKVWKEEWKRLYEVETEIAKNIKSIDTNLFLKEREFIQTAYLNKADHW